MNNMANERFPIGNGNFYAVIKELSVAEIRASHTSESFCSIEYINAEEGSFTKSQRIFNSSRWHSRILKVSREDNSIAYTAEIDDRTFSDGDVFLRSVKNSSPLYFRLVLPEHSTLLKAPKLTHDIHHLECYWIKIDCGNYEEILQISLFGDCRFDPYTKVFTLFPGESELIFSMGTIPAVISKNAARILRLLTEKNLPEPKSTFNEQAFSNIRNSLYALTVHFINNRGALAASNDKYIRLLPLYTSLRLLNKLGMDKVAKVVSSNALKSFLSVKDCVALGKGNDAQYATDIFSLVPSLIMLCAMEAPNEALIKGMIGFMMARCRIQAKTMLNGMLPFEGREYYYNNICPTTDGSAISTLFFIKSAEQICAHTQSKEISEALEAARSRFRENFIRNGRIFLNCPKRSNLSRLPKYVYAQCSFCKSPKFTWLIKNSVGAYCCDSCAAEHKSSLAPNFGVEKESYLPVLWAVYLDMDIFTPEEVEYAQNMAARELDSIPLCDAALLLHSMKRYPHKAKQQTYDHIMAKRNSLEIWYDEKGEFDTLTNSLCAHSLID